MKWKSEKGYTGIDIAVAVVVLFLFVSVIAFLSYGMNSKTKEIELQSEATHLAVEEIETLKNSNFEVLMTLGAADIDRLLPEIRDILS